MMRFNDVELFSVLDEVKKRDPALADLVDLQRELLETSLQLEPPAPLDKVDPEQMRLSLQRGIPLLHTIPPGLHWETFIARFRQVCQISARYRPDLTGELAALEHQVEMQPDSLRAEVIAALRVPQASDGNKPEAESQVLTFILQHSLRPFFFARARELAPYLHDEIWQQGYCPVCAAWPDLAYLHDGTRSRRLVCSRCDTDWRFPRVKCPFCGTTEPPDLAYYPGPEEKYRLYVCNHCRRYLKALDTAYTGVNIIYPLERMLTLPMDLAAQQAGFC